MALRMPNAGPGLFKEGYKVRSRYPWRPASAADSDAVNLRCIPVSKRRSSGTRLYTLLQARRCRSDSVRTVQEHPCRRRTRRDRPHVRRPRSSLLIKCPTRSLTFFSPRTHSANVNLGPCSSFGELQNACPPARNLPARSLTMRECRTQNRPERTEQDGHQPPRQALCHFGRRHHHPRARSCAPGG